MHWPDALGPGWRVGGIADGGGVYHGYFLLFTNQETERTLRVHKVKQPIAGG